MQRPATPISTQSPGHDIGRYRDSLSKASPRLARSRKTTQPRDDGVIYSVARGSRYHIQPFTVSPAFPTDLSISM